jgi:phosphate transport system protein
MLRASFDNELHQLQTQVLSLGSEVEENLVKVVDALIERDFVVSRRLIEADKRINARRIQIGLDSLKLIATQQPMARDMRLIAAVLEIVGELERIHDYVKGIAKTSIVLGHAPILPAFVEQLPEMAQVTRDMLHLALEAFAKRDATLARQIPEQDDLVDNIFNQLYQETINYVLESPTEVMRANQLEWAIHNLERSADRVTNICEWVVYMVTGEYAEMDSEFETPPMPGSD